MEIDSHRPSKKPRLLPTPSLTPPPLGTSSTSLFSPFRLIGLVTNEGVPFALSSDGNKLVTSAGQSYLEWNVRDLRLLGVVNVGREIKHLECNSEGRGSVWASGKGGVDMFVRGERVKRFELDEEGELLAKFIIFGSTMVALEDEGRRMYIWDMDSDEAARVIDFGPSFRASDIVHPSTYLNKVAVSSSSGTLAIWNVQTLMLLHTFIPSDLLPAPSAICAISQSPAVDLLALGFANGQVTIQDVRLGETLLTLPLSNEGSISSIAFRDGEHSQILATASSNGTITIYSLEGRPRILHTLREAHTGPIARIHFVPGQPVLLSSGSDNSLKEWNLDTPDVPRLLKQRSGHSAPPHLIRFYGEDGRILLSAGGDGQLRYVSLVRDTRSSELSQGSIEKSAKKLHISLGTLRLPAVTSIAFSPTRAKEWDDILTSHLGRQQAQSWTIDSRRKGLHVLPKKVLNGLPARCVNVTACGNFGLVGGDGEVGMWNMQSGIKRRTFSLPAGTTAVVVGVETDGLNKNVIAATTNGTIAWFDFHSASVVGTISVGAGISKTSLKRENGLLLIVCDDFKVRLIDIETRKVVREFGGFHGRILDAAFSHDSRWLITASMDSVIRTFDIPTGHLVDAFRTPSVPTSIAFSPTGDFLASTHVGNVGIALWTNRAQ
ncbi:WD40 repeat-like protein, partial [Atractiella rhizophila]